MKEISSFETVDVYAMQEPAKIDNGLFTMYLAPNQNWDKKSRVELEKEKVYVGKTMALMVRENSFVITGTEEGVVTFVKNKPNTSPIYQGEFPVNQVYNSAEDLCRLFKKAGLI